MGVCVWITVSGCVFGSLFWGFCVWISVYGCLCLDLSLWVCLWVTVMGPLPLDHNLCFSFSFSSRLHRSARKGPFAPRPVPQQSPQGCPRNNTNICLVEHRSFSILEGGMSAAFFLHSSFLQATNDVMLWPVHVQKVPQASKHLCPAKLQTRCDICCACQSICPFMPTDSGVPRAVDPQKS